MEVNHEALMQNLNAEQRYAEQHFKPLQPSAALLRSNILSRVQAEEVPTILCKEGIHLHT